MASSGRKVAALIAEKSALATLSSRRRVAHGLVALSVLGAPSCSRWSGSEQAGKPPTKVDTLLAAGGLRTTEPAQALRARAPEQPTSPLVALGRAIFFDASLSEPAGTSCASCHDPEQAFSGQHGSSAGVPRGSRPDHLARRNSPSLLYLEHVPRFHYGLEEGEVDPVPMGGLFWDGRVDTIAELTRQPLLNPDEMNNHDVASIAAKVRHAAYAPELEAEAGDLKTDEAVLRAVGGAVEAFLTTPDMSPFTSKFDDFVRGRTALSELELRGLALFKDPAKGGCSGCHVVDEKSSDPARSPFTDYGYDAVAAPRNPRLPRGRKPDLGLCERRGGAVASDSPAHCAMFRTPSLRNVGVRSSYMHNGVFQSLRDAVAFYATRETEPSRWYKSGQKYEDVPARYRANVNVTSSPYNRKAGDAPALTDAEIDAIVAFLQTLTDARVTPVTR